MNVNYVAVGPYPLSARAGAYELLAMRVNPKLIGKKVKEVIHHEVICNLEKGLDDAKVFLSAQITYED